MSHGPQRRSARSRRALLLVMATSAVAGASGLVAAPATAAAPPPCTTATAPDSGTAGSDGFTNIVVVPSQGKPTAVRLPQGVSQVLVDVCAGQGGQAAPTGAGGEGGRVQALLTFDSSADARYLYVIAGIAGTAGGPSASASGGYLGGGAGAAGGGGGGGLSGVFASYTPSQAAALVIAGGGGGGSVNLPGRAGGPAANSSTTALQGDPASQPGFGGGGGGYTGGRAGQAPTSAAEGGRNFVRSGATAVAPTSTDGTSTTDGAVVLRYATPAAAADRLIEVNGANAASSGFQPMVTGFGQATFESGPATPPSGLGSLELRTPGSGDKVQYFTSLYNAMALSNVRRLAYSTYQDQASSGGSTLPALQITIDPDGPDANVNNFTTLVFEPYLNPDQGAVAPQQWQRWDAYNGRVYSTKLIPGVTSTGGGGAVPFTSIQASNPNATFSYDGANPSYPSFGVNQGSANAGLVANTDALTLNETTFDFEPAVAPTLTSRVSPDPSTTHIDVSGTVSDASASKVTVVLRDSQGKELTGSTTTAAGSDVPYTVGFDTTSLADGTLTATTTAVDNGGNASSPATATGTKQAGTTTASGSPTPTSSSSPTGSPSSPSPTPTTTSSATSSASSSATPTGSSSTSPTGSPNPASPRMLTVEAAPTSIKPGERAVVVAHGSANRAVQLLAYSRPSTDYKVARDAATDANGEVAFSITPGTNTRLYVRYTSPAAGTDSLSLVVQVHTALSLSAYRDGVRKYHFQGRNLPQIAGQLITLYRVDANGAEIRTAITRTNTSGIWRIDRTFTGSGQFVFVVRTSQTLNNAAGRSNERLTIIH